MEAYQAAFAAGAPCMEISVGMTSDGVLICMHDATYDRTTNLTGRVNDQSSAVLAGGRVEVPRLGAYWTRNAPRIPLLEDVLLAFGNQVVLAIEAKTDKAFGPIMSMIKRYGLTDSVIVKSHYSSKRWQSAQLAGFPVFCYFGGAAEATPAAIQAVAAKLNPERDYLVVPGFGPQWPYISDQVITTAVATGVPVWVHPLHRRSDAEHFFDLGVQGVICASYAYIAGKTEPVSSESWATQAIAPGELTKDPGSDSYSPTLNGAGGLILAVRGAQHFVTLGNFSPLAAAAGKYVIDVDAGWRTLPGARTDNLTIAFGRADDSYYQHRLGRGDGYHAILRANGGMGLYRHSDGDPNGDLLGTAVATPAMVPGRPAHLQVQVSPTQIVLTRTDSGHSITVTDSSIRGGYFHLGRSSTDGIAAFSNLTVG